MQLSILFEFGQVNNDPNRSGARADEDNSVMILYFLPKLSQTRMWQALSPSICWLSPFCTYHNHCNSSTPIILRVWSLHLALEEPGEEVEWSWAFDLPEIPDQYGRLREWYSGLTGCCLYSNRTTMLLSIGALAQAHRSLTRQSISWQEDCR